MIEHFHRSLKSFLCSRLACSGWLLHLPLVLLGLRTGHTDDTSLSVSQAVYGAPLTITKEFLGSPELTSSSFLHKIENAVAGFAVSQPHHVGPSLSHKLPPALLTAQFVFVCEDAFVPSLAPLYHGPYLVLVWRDKFFRLQLGSRTDVVSVDRLKPAFSKDLISAALLPACGRPALHPALRSGFTAFSATASAQGSAKKGIRFQLLSPVPTWWNPPRTVRDRRLCSAVSLLGGFLWRMTDVCRSVPEFQDLNNIRKYSPTSER